MLKNSITKTDAAGSKITFKFGASKHGGFYIARLGAACPRVHFCEDAEAMEAWMDRFL